MSDTEDDALDSLYNDVDDSLTAGKFAHVDAQIQAVDVAGTSVTMLLGWLSITHAAAEHLPARAGLAINVVRRLVKERGEDEARELLRGLVPTDPRAGLSEHDRRELDKFADYMRRVSSAEKAGVAHVEAADAIYPDVYADGEKASEK